MFYTVEIIVNNNNLCKKIVDVTLIVQKPCLRLDLRVFDSN